jgi:hypothetical protein
MFFMTWFPWWSSLVCRPSNSFSWSWARLLSRRRPGALSCRDTSFDIGCCLEAYWLLKAF